jgi:hypothetical protein
MFCPRTLWGLVFLLGKCYFYFMKNRLLMVSFLALGIIIGAQWPELFSRWNNLVWVVVIIFGGGALWVKD